MPEDCIVTIRGPVWDDWTMTFDLGAVASAVGKRDEDGNLLMPRERVRKIMKLIRQYGTPEDIETAERMVGK